MKLMMLGAPGAGKGTVSMKLSEKLGIPQISTGDIFREEAKTNEELKKIMESGQLVPDDVVNDMVRKRLTQDDVSLGYILDGFPRTVVQAEFLDNEGIEFDHVIELDVSEDEVVKRLGSRRSCSNCKEVYNLITKPPKVEGKCDKCGGELILRDDDKEETIRKRMKEYHEKTAPLVEYYEKKGILNKVDANGTIEEVYEKSLKVVE